jgi:hypothetical protein
VRIVPSIGVLAARWLTQGCSSEDEEPQDDDGDVPMGENLTDGRAKLATKKPGDLSVYNLDTYDDDDANEAELGPFTNVKGLTYYRNNDEDPYITLKEVSLGITSKNSQVLSVSPPTEPG